MEETIEPVAFGERSVTEEAKDAEGERSAPYHDYNWDLVY